MSGRRARGERWKFASLAHQIVVARDGAPEYLERYRIQPNELAVSRPWAAGDALVRLETAQGGSYPPRAKGLQRQTRHTPLQAPRMGPCFWTARMKYSLQLG